jgi:aminoglycoside phosphotransferase (APT) family kinase protein
MSQRALDPVAILAALGLPGATGVVPVLGGQDTVLWRVAYADATYALRLFRAGEERKCQREVAAMRVAAAGGVPVPEVHTAGQWEGRPALLLSWCDGRTLVDALTAAPWRVWALGTMFGRMQAAIHRTPLPDTLRAIPERWMEWAGPVEPALRERLLGGPPHPTALLHLDYHPLNVMTDGARVTGVLDWPNARVGDPRADLARTVVLLRFRPNVSVSPVAAGIVRLLLHAWWRGYHQSAGPVADMMLFYAWAGETTVHDQEAKIARPGVPRALASYDPLRRWTAHWRRRAGLPV